MKALTFFTGLGILAFTSILSGCSSMQSGTMQGGKEAAPGTDMPVSSGDTSAKKGGGGLEAIPPTGQGNEAIFAGGCFWCMEGPFDKIEGVISTTSGYTGGSLLNPTYEQVSSGGTGHTEAIRVLYDPQKITYEQLLEVFWHNIDPTSAGGQFCDRGSQYRSGIFYLDEGQKAKAEASIAALNSSKKFPEPIVTELTKASAFYPAEEYHQDFYKKDPLRYNGYRAGCGRDRRLAELWGSSGH